MTIDEAVAPVANELRAANGVLVVGAGASVGAGYPLTYHLRPHLWRAVDADPDVLAKIAGRLGVGTLAAKTLVGDDEKALREAYELVKASPIARLAFQLSFQSLDRVRSMEFSPTYDAIAELVHRRRIELVVSLNWDTMLEAAYRRRYGRTLTPDGEWLYKPHGDANNLDSDWVLPHEPGYVPERLVERVTQLAQDRPRVLLVVGYSEQDQAIVDRLIRPLEERWRVARIGPQVVGPLSVPFPADGVMSRMRDSITGGCPEVPGWEYVTFQSQNDLGAALDGRGLGPSDVEACPNLPEVSTLVAILRAAGSATVEGPPGSGKSMVAYHAAYELFCNGWEVLRPAEPARDRLELLAQLDALPVRTLVIVDDAQQLDPALVRGLKERASPRTPVLLVTNGATGDARGVVHISGKRAVAALAAALRDRRDETLGMVRRFDPRVGDAWGDTPLEVRLQQAEREAGLPWQLSFILTGGEVRARDDLARLAEEDHADLLLAAVAARQIATRDVGVTPVELERFAGALCHDAQWARRALEIARQYRLVVGEQFIRCPHQRYAGAVLRIIVDKRSSQWPRLVRMLREAILCEDPPLYSIAALLDELRFADAGVVAGEAGVLDESALGHLKERLLAATTAVERAGAASLLKELRDFDPHRECWIREQASTVGRWLTEATAESAWSVAGLVNEFYNIRGEDRGAGISQAVFGHADPAAVARSLAIAPHTEWHAWGQLLGRLWIAGGEWCERLREALPRQQFLAQTDGVAAGDVHCVAALSVGLSAIDDKLAITMLDRAVRPIAARMSNDLPRSYYEFHEAFELVLGYGLFRPRVPSARQRAVARRIVSGLDVVAVAASICRAPRRMLSNSARVLAVVREAHPQIGDEIIQRLDLDAIDRAAPGVWKDPPHELVEFVASIRDEDGEPSRSWIGRHEAEIRNMPGLFVFIAPDVALRVRERGAHVDLRLSGVLGWGVATNNLKQLWARGETTARIILRDHIEEMGKELLIRQSNQCEDLEHFVNLVLEVAPETLAEAFMGMDSEEVEKHWAARLQGTTKERRAAAALVRAAGESEHLRTVAGRLRSRFPGAVRDRMRDQRLSGGESTD